MGKTQSPTTSTSTQSTKRVARLSGCQCKNCKKDNCGKCKNCKNMVIFGGPGTRKARCLHRVCELRKSSSSNVQPMPSVTKEKSKVVVKEERSEKHVKTEKAKSVGTNTDVSRGILVPKSPRRSSQYLGSSQSSSRVKADLSVKTQTDSKVQTSTNSKPTADIVKTPQDSGKNCPENKLARTSPRIKAVIQSVVPASKQTSDDAPNQQGTAVSSNSSKDISSSISSKENAAPADGGNALPENATVAATSQYIDLPSVKLDSMSKAELKEFIPKLLKLVTGKEEVFYSRRSAKPEWWPDDVVWAVSRAAWFSEKYWTDNLRSVVKNCYKHVGKEDLLQTLVDSSNFNSRYSECLHDQAPQDAQNEDSVKTGSYPSSPVKIKMFPQDLFLPFSAEIYICYFCEKEFLSKEKMRSHQKECVERPPDLQNMYSSTSAHNSASSVQIPTMSPKNVVVKNWSVLSLDKFSGHLDLVPKHTAIKLRQQRLSIEEVNCEILDDAEPMSPVTPKTPKSLISQLSREDSSLGSRKRLSYSLSMEVHKDGIIEEADSDSDAAESEQRNKTVHENNFLDIPISSLLGQRIKNYVHVDTPMGIVEDTGSFCRTPVKNTFLEKLRKKPLAYPILYRPRRIANLHKQNHIYRFKRSEVKEFMCKTNTGLSLASLEKLRSMKKFTIRVRRLSRKMLLNWMSRKRLDKQLRGAFKGLKYNPYSELDETECEFPSGPTLLAKNIDKLLGLKKRSSQENSNMSMKNTLSLSNFISEEMEAEISKQKLTLYRSLLYEMSVLKPAVVMEDIGCQVKEETHGKKQGGSKISAKVDVSKDREVRPKSVLRDMLGQGKEDSFMSGDGDRKEDYQTLKSLLIAPKTPENTKYVTKSRHAKATPTSMDIYDVKKMQKSPNDDSVSILSASSEGDSLHSGCCQGCCDKKHNSSRQTSAIVPNVSPSETITPQLIQPLHVDVDLNTMKIDEYGIPSPMSISSESPFPPTPSKSSSNLPDSSGKRSAKDNESEDNSPVVKREMRSTRSSGISSPSTNIDSSLSALTGSKSHDKLNLSSVSESLIKNSMRRVQSESIQTRSCTNTPNSSPVKRLTRSGSSAPVSPSKVSKQSRLPLDVKQVSKNLEGSSLSQTSKSDVKFKLRSGMSGSDIEKCDSSDSSNMSPHLATNKQQSSGSGLVAKNNNDKNAAVESPLRRSKRRSSFMSEGVQPTKLRKVYSDMAVNTR